MRRIVTTNHPHLVVCTPYMHAPGVGSDVIWSAVHAAPSHDIVNDTLGLSCVAPEHRSWLRVHTVWYERTIAMSSNP